MYEMLLITDSKLLLLTSEVGHSMHNLVGYDSKHISIIRANTSLL